jgi:hypothetical protein
MLRTWVPVEKVSFLKKRRKMGDRKCLGDPRKSLLGHPGAILFLAFSFGRLFQQALGISHSEAELRATIESELC